MLTPHAGGQPANPRRRPYSGRNDFYRIPRNSDSDYAPGNLELSMHWPSSPSSNRFDLLAAPPATQTAKRERDGDRTSARPQRRVRNTRGSKEGKRRRDARRVERKWAAFLLDEQFSMQVDETLRRANILPPPIWYPQQLPAPNRPVQPQPGNAVVRYCPSSSFQAPTRPSVPPQLPAIDFSRFEVRDFPGLTSPPKMPGSNPFSQPSRSLTNIPSWCPPIPCLQRNHAEPDGMPTFFDLSSLPEPTTNAFPTVPCQALQLWKGNDVLSKPRQSRFFPPGPSCTPIVKLPRTGCKLHDTDGGYSQDLGTCAPFTTPEPTPPKDLSEAVEQAVDIAKSHLEKTSPATAANLWQILSSSPSDANNLEEKNLNGVSQPSRGDEDAEAAYDTAPAELDGKEIPYVHANSLIGHANEIAASYGANASLSDSVALLAGAFLVAAEDFFGKHEKLISDANSTQIETQPQEVWDTSLPAELPEFGTPPSHDHLTASTLVGPDDAVPMDAQFRSEQELFKTPKVLSAAESMCDLKEFLKMGHVEHCWCRDCDETPTLVDEDRLTEDDGWMVWSSADNESTSTPATDVQTLDDEDVETPQQGRLTNPTWSEIFPHLPARKPQRSVDEMTDDADFCEADFEDLSEEYDWCWNF